MPEGFDKFVGTIGDTLKIVPALYEDAFQPAAQETGKFVARIPHAINAAFSSLDKWILNKEYAIDETKKLLEQKLKTVDPDKIVTPETYVAVPAIQAISYSMNSEELRNLYANLLAKAMNSDTKDLVHPSFVEIIKQMSPIDSLVFKTIMERQANPVIDIVYQKQKEGCLFSTAAITFAKNISDIDIAPVEIVCVSIDNLIKQSLISIPHGQSYTKEELYNNILNSQFYLEQQAKLPNLADGAVFSHTKKMIEYTNLGMSFYNVCVSNDI